jgi:hypothetical protein
VCADGVILKRWSALFLLPSGLRGGGSPAGNRVIHIAHS